MISIKFRKKLQGILKEGKLDKKIESIMNGVGLLYEREYKMQVPVDRGDLRRNVKSESRTKGNEYSVIIGTESYNRGKNYAIFVHEGTGKYRGSKIDYNAGNFSSGRTRASNYYGFGSRDEAQAFFGSLAKKGIRMSIKPNKFAWRTKDKVDPQAIKFFIKQLNKLV